MRWMLMLLTVALAMQARAGEPGANGARDAWTRLQAKVERDGTPRERALVSQISKGTDEAERARGGSVLRAAAAAAPADLLVQWLWATSPLEPADCASDIACAERAWAAARLAPDNAAAWAPVLSQAVNAKDSQATRAALERMANATYYAEPFAEVVDAWRDLLHRHPLPPSFYAQPSPYPSKRVASREELDAIAAVAFTAAMVSPIHGLSTYCNAEAASPPPAEDLALCRRAAALMLEAPTISQRSMGTGLLRRAGGPDGAGFQRQQLWRVSELVDMERDGRGMLQYFDDLVSTGSEIRAMELALQRAGKPLTPPADWVWVSPYANVEPATESRGETGEAAKAPARPATPSAH